MKIFIKDGGGLIVEGYVLAMENSRSKKLERRISERKLNESYHPRRQDFSSEKKGVYLFVFGIK